jgi:DNA-binding CsgD family transcriptional regulator
MAMHGTDKIPSIIDDLYAGTLDQAAWNRAMVSMADLVRGTGTVLFGVNPRDSTILRDEIHRFDPVVVAEYRAHWASKDIRLGPGFRIPVGEAVFESKVLSTRDLRSSELYNDFLTRVDSPSFLVFWLYKTADKVVALTIQGSRSRGPFDERDGDLIKPLIPHLRRTLEIKDRLETTAIRSGRLVPILDSLSFGVLVLDDAGRIVEASSVAMDMLNEKSALGRHGDGTLWLRGPAGKQLNHWLRTGVPCIHQAEGLLHAWRPDAPPVSVTVTRLPPHDASWFGSGSASWVLLLFDPDRELPASTELIARDLGISGREAHIAGLLGSGLDIQAIARRLSISTHTVRTHLKAIFGKTGVRSQSELILRIRRGPGGINAFK